MKKLIIIICLLLVGCTYSYGQTVMPDWQVRYIIYQLSQGNLTQTEVDNAVADENLFVVTPENELKPPALAGQLLLLLSKGH